MSEAMPVFLKAYRKIVNFLLKQLHTEQSNEKMTIVPAIFLRTVKGSIVNFFATDFGGRFPFDGRGFVDHCRISFPEDFRNAKHIYDSYTFSGSTTHGAD